MLVADNHGSRCGQRCHLGKNRAPNRYRATFPWPPRTVGALDHRLDGGVSLQAVFGAEHDGPRRVGIDKIVQFDDRHEVLVIAGNVRVVVVGLNEHRSRPPNEPGFFCAHGARTSATVR